MLVEFHVLMPYLPFLSTKLELKMARENQPWPFHYSKNVQVVVPNYFCVCNRGNKHPFMQEYAANTQAHFWQTSSEENALKSWFYGKQVVNVNPCSRCTNFTSIFLVPNYSLHQLCWEMTHWEIISVDTVMNSYSVDNFWFQRHQFIVVVST